jgi:hypothetical protein
VVTVEEDADEYLGRMIDDRVESAPYPRQYGPRPGLLVMMDESGVYKPSAYNRWGIVGTFLVTKVGRGGGQLSLTDREVEAVLADLADADGGYLDPASGVLNPFRGPFAVYGVPPSGAVPQAGCWFK